MAAVLQLFLLVVLCACAHTSIIDSKRKHSRFSELPYKRLLSRKSQHKKNIERVSFKECNLASDERLDCGFPGIAEEECNRRECCWTPTEEAAVPTCYHSIPTIQRQCLIMNEDRQHCGWPGMRKEQCLALECCWQPSIDKTPWCYESKSVPIYEGTCGKTAITPNILSRVIGGEEAIPNSWPWMVSLQRNGAHVCGGSLINHQWVLSAAHCGDGVIDLDAENTILLGAHSLSDVESTQIRVEVDQVVVHEGFGYSPFTPDGQFGGVMHDILLIRLKQPIEFNDVVSPVCLASELPRGGTRCYSMGWGLDAFSFSEEGVEWSAPDRLQQFMSPVVDRDLCNSTDWYNGRVHSTSMCAGYEEGGRGNCFGDSGGPLVCNEDGVWKEVGTVSWGEPCALARFPTIYGEVSQHVAWMQKQIPKYDD